MNNGIDAWINACMNAGMNAGMNAWIKTMKLGGAGTLLFLSVAVVQAQGSPTVRSSESAAERTAVIAVADSALAAISRGDMNGFTDLMVLEAVLFPTRTRDGVTTYRQRTRAEQRSSPVTGVITERGWNADVRISGGVAIVWYPYDLYIDSKWSHCGADVFTLVRQEGRWRILTMAWSAEQPPVCEKHPQGPPAA